MSPEPLDFFFADDARSVVLRAHLNMDWRLLRSKVYGFDRRSILPWKDGWSIRGHVQVYAGRRCFDRGSDAPASFCQGKHELGSYRLSNGVFETTIALNIGHLDQDDKGRPRLRILQQPFLKIDPGLYYSFCCWIVFHGPEPAPPPDVREWGQKMFLPGGRPESNRRKF